MAVFTEALTAELSFLTLITATLRPALLGQTLGNFWTLRLSQEALRLGRCGLSSKELNRVEAMRR